MVSENEIHIEAVLKTAKTEITEGGNGSFRSRMRYNSEEKSKGIFTLLMNKFIDKPLIIKTSREGDLLNEAEIIQFKLQFSDAIDKLLNVSTWAGDAVEDLPMNIAQSVVDIIRFKNIHQIYTTDKIVMDSSLLLPDYKDSVIITERKIPFLSRPSEKKFRFNLGNISQKSKDTIFVTGRTDTSLDVVHKGTSRFESEFTMSVEKSKDITSTNYEKDIHLSMELLVVKQSTELIEIKEYLSKYVNIKRIKKSSERIMVNWF